MIHRAATATGGVDDGGGGGGAPDYRPHYHPGYYGAYVLDPDGHNIKAAFHDHPRA